MGSNILAAPAGGWSIDKWMYLAVPLALYSIAVLALLGAGRSEEKNLFRFFFRQISDSLERLTGFPGWSMAGVLTGLMMLLIAVVGFYWDVAWHIDFGRDKSLFTPPHVMILVGLGGIGFAAAVATLFATIDRAEVGFSILGLRVPWSAITLSAMSVGAVAAFPLDNLWHKAYGLDVTLWSPTHLQLVGGGALATLALWLMIAEAWPKATPTGTGHAVQILVAGAALAGMTTFQGEFDYGVPQFQILYFPILVAAAAGFTLVLARIALGPGGALKAAGFYLVLRGVVALLVTGALGHTFPRFPLYLPSALAVEGVAMAVGTAKRLRFGLVAGAVVGTVALAFELAWAGIAGYGPGSPALLPKIAIFGPLAAVCAAVLGQGLGRAFSEDHEPSSAPALALAGIGLIAILAYPLPRNVGTVHADIRLARHGDMGLVSVTLDPPDAARNAIAFGASSWQGGGRISAALKETGPGTYVATRELPVYGRWKTVIGLYRGDQVMAAPVYLPADPAIGASSIPAVPERQTVFIRNTKLLLREAHPGPPLPADLAYAGWATSMGIWIALMALTALVASRARQAGEVRTHTPTTTAGGPYPAAPVLAPQWSTGGWHASGAG